MSRFDWSSPFLWEESLEGKVPSDILAEERKRRLQRWRRFRYVLPWNWFAGRAGVVVLCLFLVLGLAWMGFRQLDAPSSGHAAPFPTALAPAVPERVRGLSAAEHSLASRYGFPLHLGPGGKPVIRVESTGSVRELTSFEMDLDSPVSRLFSRSGVVVQVPGPRGWGMWWLDDSEKVSLRPLVSLDRLSWRERQERELSRVVRGVLLALSWMDRVDLGARQPGLGDAFLDLASRIRDPYPPAEWGRWGAVPGLWVCDRELESDLHQGVTSGCPGREYGEALQDAWIRVGAVVDRLERVGRFMGHMDKMDSADLYESGARAELFYEVLDMTWDYRDLASALARLRQVSGEWGLHVSVDLAGER